MWHYLKNILQLLLSPRHGWDEVSHDVTEPDELASHGLYPLIGLASVTYFVQGIYSAHFELVPYLQGALAIFLSLFISFFIGKYVLESTTAQFIDTGKLNTFKTNTLSTYIVGILAVIQVVSNLMPVQVILVYLLPIVAIITIWKSCQYLDIMQEKSLVFTIICSIAIIGSKMLLDVLFSVFLS